LRGVRGPKGGYLLARERRKISLSDIMEAVNADSAKKMKPESRLRQYITTPIWMESKKSILQHYSQISLADLCQQATAAGLTIEVDKKGDFNI